MKSIDVGRAAKPLQSLYACNTIFLVAGIFFGAALVGDIVAGKFGIGSISTALVCAPATWLAWRTRDPVRAVLYRPASAIYWYTVAIGVVGLGILALGAVVLLVDESAVDYAMMFAMLVGLELVAYFGLPAFLGALSLRKLKRTEIAPLGVTLAGLGGTPAGQHDSGRISMSMRVNAKRGSFLLGLAAVVFISYRGGCEFQAPQKCLRLINV